MKVTITIDCGTEAFAEAPEQEVAAVLEHLTGELLEDFTSINLLDSNGKATGRCEVSE
jgi:enhancing lycopene biosynthesis protein 2